MLLQILWHVKQSIERTFWLITNCGNAQNCVKACPMNIPLTKAIYEENCETVLYGLLGWLKK
jgi:succinate dehydrogenase/fumarate reductase-like Fe-S protein